MRIFFTLAKALLGVGVFLGVTTMPEDFAGFLRRVADMIAGGEHVELWVISAALVLWAAFDVFKWFRENHVQSGKQSRAAPTVGAGEDRIAQCRINQPRAPRAVTWISETQTLQIIQASSLVCWRIPNDVTVADTLARALGDTYKTPGEQRAGEVSRHLLREFGSEIPEAVRSGQYGKEPLKWWIDKEADRRTSKGSMNEVHA